MIYTGYVLLEDSPNDFQSFDDHQPRRSTASSPRTPHVPDHISSLTIPRSNLSKPESRPISNSLERNTQELIDQMKTLIETLRLLLENKIDIRSYADRKKIKKKTKQSSSDRTKNNPFSEYMTITKCNFPTDHSRKSMIVNRKNVLYISLDFRLARTVADPRQ